MSVDISKYRQWICEFQFPDHKAACFGTLWVEPGTSHKQIKKEMRAMLLEYVPDGFAMNWVLPGRCWAEVSDNLKPGDMEDVP